MTERKHKALSFANRALAWAEKTGNQAYVRTTHGIRARLISELGNISAGAELAEQVHVRSRSDRGRLDRSFSLALMHADAGNLPRALVLLRECLDEVHTRRLQLPANQRYLFMERYAEIGRKYVYYLAKQGDWRSAFEVSEEVQARTVLDLMFRHQIKRQQGRTITSGPNGRLHLNTAGCETVAEFLSQHSACMLKFFFPHKDLLIGWVMTPDGAVLGWDASAGIPHLREARGKLPVSHYVEFATNVKIKEGMIEVCPPPMTRASRGSSFVDWDGALRDLSGFYEKAICDCARAVLQAHEGNLVIVPHMELDAIPFGLLGPLSGPRLGANWAITTVPSANAGLQLDIRRDVSPRVKGKADFRALLIGDCGPQGVAIPPLPTSKDTLSLLKFCDLPGTRAEIAHLHSMLGGIVLTQSAATRERVVRHFAESDIIHFANSWAMGCDVLRPVFPLTGQGGPIREGNSGSVDAR